jgi:hypothetical protein
MTAGYILYLTIEFEQEGLLKSIHLLRKRYVMITSTCRAQ